MKINHSCNYESTKMVNYHCCGKNYIWLPTKDTILTDDEEPPKKAQLVHA